MCVHVYAHTWVCVYVHMCAWTHRGGRSEKGPTEDIEEGRVKPMVSGCVHLACPVSSAIGQCEGS